MLNRGFLDRYPTTPSASSRLSPLDLAVALAKAGFVMLIRKASLYFVYSSGSLARMPRLGLKSPRLNNKFASVLLVIVLWCSSAHAVPTDPFDPFAFPDPDSSTLESSVPDDLKSSMELLTEARSLMMNDRPIDARTKLLKVLTKDPKEYRAHLMLAAYYSEFVGHFRLALRYLERAQELFTEKYGLPPYRDPFVQADHADLLFTLSQVQLDLDNYKGSLATLDKYMSYSYTRTGYPAARAWVLMKLGNLEEAIGVARAGVSFGNADGRMLNMLGILLSMHGEGASALQVFREALTQELALGAMGRPATPLNNSGEVYREMFDDDKAESAWLKATRANRDGCEHVLPSLNLALLYIDQANYHGAKKAIDDFEECVKQFPLRNGEEHKALVKLIRGRLALHGGNPDLAIRELDLGLEGVQWFGKIGTNEEDLRAGLLQSLSWAHEIKANIFSFYRPESTWEWAWKMEEQAAGRTKAWWIARKARSLLASRLKNFEDIYVRNTDSMLEYSSLGILLSGFPEAVLNARIEHERKTDTRPEAEMFYKEYIAENTAHNGSSSAAVTMLQELLKVVRPKFDDGLTLRIKTALLGFQSANSEGYQRLAYDIFNISPAALRNGGFSLPVNLSDDNATETNGVAGQLESSGFIVNNSRPLPLKVVVSGGIVKLVSTPTGAIVTSVSGTDAAKVANQFSDKVFTTVIE